MIQNQQIAQVINKLSELNKRKIESKVVVGFDGFVDNILRAISSRSANSFEYFNTIKHFSEHVGQAAGKSSQIELVSQELKLGGNAPIMAYSLGRMGVPVKCIGSMGYPDLHPVFKPLTEIAEVISVCQPGITDAFEFDDGKLIFSELTSFTYFNWEYLKDKVGLNKIKEIFSESFLISLVDWVNLNHATNIWEGILNEVVADLNDKDKNYFFDIADPSKRPAEDVLSMIKVLGGYKKFGHVTLGINENEARKLFAVLVKENDLKRSLMEIGSKIYKRLQVDVLLIHPVDRTLVFTAEGVIEQRGRLVERPKISTGGGDNFNAGFCLGMMQQYPLEECMILGMAASGSYVQNGTSPDLQELIDYLNIWEEELT